jgi:hypothetical protein
MQQNSKVSLLSERDVRNIEPVRHARKITVGKCLYLNVTPKGGRRWYYKSYFEGKCRKLMLGTYPEISLSAKLFKGAGKFFLWEGGFIGEAVVVLGASLATSPPRSL